MHSCFMRRQPKRNQIFQLCNKIITNLGINLFTVFGVLLPTLFIYFSGNNFIWYGLMVRSIPWPRQPFISTWIGDKHIASQRNNGETEGLRTGTMLMSPLKTPLIGPRRERHANNWTLFLCGMIAKTKKLFIYLLRQHFISTTQYGATGWRMSLADVSLASTTDPQAGVSPGFSVVPSCIPGSSPSTRLWRQTPSPAGYGGCHSCSRDRHFL